MKIKIASFLIIMFAILFYYVPIVLAGDLDPIVPQGSAYETGNYELNDVMRMGINITNIILGVVGSLALLMFVYGGVMMLISAGNSDKVSKAKGIIIAAVIGLGIVFASYLIIQFVMGALGVNWQGNTTIINCQNTNDCVHLGSDYTCKLGVCSK